MTEAGAVTNEAAAAVSVAAPPEPAAGATADAVATTVGSTSADAPLVSAEKPAASPSAASSSATSAAAAAAAVTTTVDADVSSSIVPDAALAAVVAWLEASSSSVDAVAKACINLAQELFNDPKVLESRASFGLVRETFSRFWAFYSSVSAGVEEESHRIGQEASKLVAARARDLFEIKRLGLNGVTQLNFPRERYLELFDAPRRAFLRCSLSDDDAHEVFEVCVAAAHLFSNDKARLAKDVAGFRHIHNDQWAVRSFRDCGYGLKGKTFGRFETKIFAARVRDLFEIKRFGLDGVQDWGYPKEEYAHWLHAPVAIPASSSPAAAPSASSSSVAPLPAAEPAAITGDLLHQQTRTTRLSVGGAGIAIQRRSASQAASRFETLEWALCDACKKWRVLAPKMKPADLPKKWFCKYNTWDTAYARCSVPQQEYEGVDVYPEDDDDDGDDSEVEVVDAVDARASRRAARSVAAASSVASVPDQPNRSHGRDAGSSSPVHPSAVAAAAAAGGAGSAAPPAPPTRSSRRRTGETQPENKSAPTPKGCCPCYWVNGGCVGGCGLQHFAYTEDAAVLETLLQQQSRQPSTQQSRQKISAKADHAHVPPSSPPPPVAAPAAAQVLPSSAAISPGVADVSSGPSELSASSTAAPSSSAVTASASMPDLMGEGVDDSPMSGDGVTVVPTADMDIDAGSAAAASAASSSASPTAQSPTTDGAGAAPAAVSLDSIGALQAWLECDRGNCGDIVATSNALARVFVNDAALLSPPSHGVFTRAGNGTRAKPWQLESSARSWPNYNRSRGTCIGRAETKGLGARIRDLFEIRRLGLHGAAALNFPRSQYEALQVLLAASAAASSSSTKAVAPFAAALRKGEISLLGIPFSYTPTGDDDDAIGAAQSPAKLMLSSSSFAASAASTTGYKSALVEFQAPHPKPASVPPPAAEVIIGKPAFVPPLTKAESEALNAWWDAVTRGNQEDGVDVEMSDASAASAGGGSDDAVGRPGDGAAAPSSTAVLQPVSSHAQALQWKPITERVVLKCGDARVDLFCTDSALLNARVVLCNNYNGVWYDAPAGQHAFQSQMFRLLARMMPRGSILVSATQFTNSNPLRMLNTAVTDAEKELKSMGLSPDQANQLNETRASAGRKQFYSKLMTRELCALASQSRVLVDEMLFERSASYMSTVLYFDVAGGWPSDVPNGLEQHVTLSETTSSVPELSSDASRLKLLNNDRYDAICEAVFLDGRRTPQYEALQYVITQRYEMLKDAFERSGAAAIFDPSSAAANFSTAALNAGGGGGGAAGAGSSAPWKGLKPSRNGIGGPPLSNAGSKSNGTGAAGAASMPDGAGAGAAVSDASRKRARPAR